MQAIAIEFQPSKLLLGLLCAISIVCCVILAQLPVSIPIKLVLIVFVLASSIYFALRDALLRLPQSWQSAEVSSQGKLKLTNKRGDVFEPKLSASSLIHNLLTILNFERIGFKKRLSPAILLTNVENQEELRKLRVWLRWWKHQDEALSAD